MTRRIMALFFGVLLTMVSVANTSAAVPTMIRMDDDSSCADPSRQASPIYGGWQGFSNQASMVVWLAMDPAIDPTGSNLYTVNIYDKKGDTLIIGQPLQFSAPCPSPDELWRYAELVYGGFVSGEKYLFVVYDSSGNPLGSDTTKLVNGPGI